MARIASKPVLVATNSAPKTDVLMVHCRLEYQTKGALLRYTTNRIRPRLYIYLVSSMIGVHEKPENRCLAPWLWYVEWDGLFYVSVKITPVGPIIELG
jgi:hypothetical protein